MGPSPVLVSINHLLHKEPYSSLGHGLFWSFVLLFLCPLVGMMHVSSSLYQAVKYYYPNPITTTTKNTYNIETKHKNSHDDNCENPNNADAELAIYITGCDSGFGNQIVLQLAQQYKHVTIFAACLSSAAVERFLECYHQGNIIPIQVDVRNNHDCQKAADIVSLWLQHKDKDDDNNHNDNEKVKETNSSENDTKPKPKPKRYLHAIINNAGIVNLGLIDWTDLSTFQNVMDVNYFGTIRTVKAFLPIFKSQSQSQSQSSLNYNQHRIINMISMAGLSYSAGLSCYHASKYAQEAFTSCLRTELDAWNIPVISINPSFHDTPMPNSMESQLHSFWEHTLSKTSNIKEEYGMEFFQNFKQQMMKKQSTMWNANIVVDSVISCIMMESTQTKPITSSTTTTTTQRASSIVQPISFSTLPSQVIIGSDAKYGILLFRMLPVWIQEILYEFMCPLGLTSNMMNQ